jgi:hypothetical protein
MEDISRELEREIAQAKPKPFKQDCKTRILIVDDFGQMKSGDYLKKLSFGLTIISLVCFCAAAIFYYRYSTISGNTKHIRSSLNVLEKKNKELVREKEVLMARLVISGKEPGIESGKPGSDAETLTSAPSKEKNLPEPEPLKVKTALPGAGKIKAQPEPLKSALPPSDTASRTKPVETPPADTPKPKPASLVVKNVSIEKFTVTNDKINGDLLVRFDIRNISTEPGDVSGRIFTVLKPDNEIDSKWLVVPNSRLISGIPSEFKKGQYFSIAHFKTVKFRIKNNSDPDFFKKASIFIFNNQGEVIFEDLIDITEAS